MGTGFQHVSGSAETAGVVDGSRQPMILSAAVFTPCSLFLSASVQAPSGVERQKVTYFDVSEKQLVMTAVSDTGRWSLRLVVGHFQVSW